MFSLSLECDCSIANISSFSCVVELGLPGGNPAPNRFERRTTQAQGPSWRATSLRVMPNGRSAQNQNGGPGPQDALQAPITGNQYMNYLKHIATQSQQQQQQSQKAPNTADPVTTTTTAQTSSTSTSQTTQIRPTIVTNAPFQPGLVATGTPANGPTKGQLTGRSTSSTRGPQSSLLSAILNAPPTAAGGSGSAGSSGTAAGARESGRTVSRRFSFRAAALIGGGTPLGDAPTSSAAASAVAGLGIGMNNGLNFGATVTSQTATATAPTLRPLGTPPSLAAQAGLTRTFSIPSAGRGRAVPRDQREPDLSIAPASATATATVPAPAPAAKVISASAAVAVAPQQPTVITLSPPLEQYSSRLFAEQSPQALGAGKSVPRSSRSSDGGRALGVLPAYSVHTLSPPVDQNHTARS